MYMDSEYLRDEFYSKLSTICADHGLPIIDKPAISEENSLFDVEENGTDGNMNHPYDHRMDVDDHANSFSDLRSPLKLKINLKKS